MPRKYTPAPGARRYKKYGIPALEAAKTDISNGLTYKGAAIKHRISKTVIARYVKHLKTSPNSVPKSIGGQTTLSPELEKHIVDKLIKCSDWGYPLDCYDLRIIIETMLDRKGVRVAKFRDNFPGQDFAKAFLKRHRRLVSERFFKNIKYCGAQVNPKIINDYFDHLEESLRGVPAENIVNYDETNLSDNPGKKRAIAKRGCKYPERVMNGSKSNTSIMFAGSGTGELLTPYVVYKAVNLYDTWTKRGPFKIRYNRSKSAGWFDGLSFEDWVLAVAIPFLRRKAGTKILIGDNLSSHLSVKIVEECEKYNIKFVFLPANSTDKTQPLDVAFYAPLKRYWRGILSDWKLRDGKKETSVPKASFPDLLTKLLHKISDEAQLDNDILRSIFKTDQRRVRR